MTHNLEARLSSYYPIALAVFRVVIGLLFLCQGMTKLFGWPDAAHKAAVGEWPYYYAGWIELVTSLLIIAGLFTRPAAFIACGEMAFAYFTQHLPHGFFPITNGGELAVLYCFAFLLLIFAGGGAYALDARRGRWRSTVAPRRPGWRRNRRRLRR
jgi:putative oxidoreductase